MIERIALIVLLLAAGVTVYWLLGRWQLRRAARVALADPLLAEAQPGKPTIIYFTTPTCAPCRFQQTPILERLQAELAELQVVRVDATQNPDAARRWGVLSVPTLFVLDKQGQPGFVHNGVVDADTLKRQLSN